MLAESFEAHMPWLLLLCTGALPSCPFTSYCLLFRAYLKAFNVSHDSSCVLCWRSCPPELVLCVTAEWAGSRWPVCTAITG